MENKETKANEPINIIYNSANVHSSIGLTKREYFAAMALQGLLVKNYNHHEYCVYSAVEYADGLILELNKPPQN